jgi:hypothetical protein
MEDQMSKGIDYFNRGHWLTDIHERVSLATRKRMFKIAVSKLGLKAGQTMVDFGTTPDVERQDSNCMIPWFADLGMSVALASPEDITHLATVFSFARILPATGFHYPIAAGVHEFDLVTSSAVLEHCGDRVHQIAHIKECARVADRIFLTIPNRWHWLEFHTKIPLMHWLPKSMHRGCLDIAGLHFWAKEENLNLLSVRQLKELADEALRNEFEYQIQRVWTLGMPSNLILLAYRLLW